MTDCENLCHKAGCIYNPQKNEAPSCCHDIVWERTKRKIILENFPHAIEVGWNEPVPKKDGVYFKDIDPLELRNDGYYNCYINGRCPKLQSDGGCKMPHPSPCQNAKRGGRVCVEHRKKDGRKPIDPKYVEK